MENSFGFLRRCWTEINLKQIEINYKAYQKKLPTGAEIMAVIKADAYGHGAIQVALALSEIGLKFFAVSNIHEALELRQAGVTGEILVLGYTPISWVNELYENDITQTLVSREYAEDFSMATNLPVKCQFAIDTGMNRIGLDAKKTEECIADVKGFAKKLNITGIFTHLCVADSEDEASVAYTNLQLRLFEKIVDGVSSLSLRYVHCLNSAGGLEGNRLPTELNRMVRLGIIMYGLKPSYENKLPEGVAPALEWKSVVSMIKEVKAGASIGYGRSFVVEKDSKIATLPVGYADGYNRLLSNCGYVLIRGKRAPIVGRVCMDQMMVDVSGVDGVSVNDEVVLIGTSGDETLTADDMAQIIGTIGYEVVCNISKRVFRIYK